MSKRVTAREAYANGIMNSKDVLTIKAEQAEADKMKHIIGLTKTLVQCHGVPFARAARIAKRAYRMGVRIN
jgi:hypothetical protein